MALAFITDQSILPCPFCGGRPIWTHLVVADNHFHLKCEECSFEMKQDRRDKVIGFWNRRQSSAQKFIDGFNDVPHMLKEQVEFIQNRVRIWNGSTKAHRDTQKMYKSVLETLLRLTHLLYDSPTKN